MHITHALGHLLPARWRLAAATLVVASCVTLALAIGATASAMASASSSPVLQPNMPAATGAAAGSVAASAAAIGTDIASLNECQPGGTNCWEYYSWYWTYASCHAAGKAQVAANPGRYDNYFCQSLGPVVRLWLHVR